MELNFDIYVRGDGYSNFNASSYLVGDSFFQECPVWMLMQLRNQKSTCRQHKGNFVSTQLDDVALGSLMRVSIRNYQ